MNEQELRQWMRRIEDRLSKLELPDCPPQPTDIPGEPDTIPAPPVTITWQTVAGAFSKRYEAKRGLAWHYGPHIQALTDIAEWIDRQGGDGKGHLERLLDGFFTGEYAEKLDYPPGLLAKQCGRFYAPPVVKREDEPDPEAINAKRLRDRRIQEQAALVKALHEMEQGASPPPPLEALIDKIGRKL